MAGQKLFQYARAISGEEYPDLTFRLQVEGRREREGRERAGDSLTIGASWLRGLGGLRRGDLLGHCAPGEPTLVGRRGDAREAVDFCCTRHRQCFLKGLTFMELA